MLNKRYLIVLAVSLLPAANSAGGLIYDIVPRPGITEGWSLDGGWIETDGTIGEITFANFVSWELNFTSPSGGNTISSENGHSLSLVTDFNSITIPNSDPPPPFVASHEQLVANPAGNRVMSLYFSDQSLFADEFSGQAVVFFPSTESAVRLTGSNQRCCGWLVDNTIDNENLVSPFVTLDASATHRTSAILKYHMAR